MEEERRDIVEEAEEFLLIFAAVVFVTWFIKLLCRPFQGAGWKGWILGFFAVPLLLFALVLEGMSFAQAEDVYGIDCVTVKVPVANVRGTAEIGDNIIRKARKGDKFCTSVQEAWNPKWIEFTDPDVGYLYVHRSVVEITEKKTGTTRSDIWDSILIIMIILYGMSAYASWQERQRRHESFSRAFNE